MSEVPEKDSPSRDAINLRKDFYSTLNQPTIETSNPTPLTDFSSLSIPSPPNLHPLLQSWWLNSIQPPPQTNTLFNFNQSIYQQNVYNASIQPIQTLQSPPIALNNTFLSPQPVAPVPPVPPVTPLKRAPERKKRVRILQEGQLTMIVYGANEVLTWARRIALFQNVMRDVLGNRRKTFTWSGSVTDSVIGAFLTQNVSDLLSSRAYMEVASRWPAQYDKCVSVQGSGGGDGSVTDTVDWEAVRIAPMDDLIDAIKCRGLQVILSRNIKQCLDMVRRYNIRRLALTEIPMAYRPQLMAMIDDDVVMVLDALVGAVEYAVEHDIIVDGYDGNDDDSTNHGVVVENACSQEHVLLPSLPPSSFFNTTTTTTINNSDDTIAMDNAVEMLLNALEQSRNALHTDTTYPAYRQWSGSTLYEQHYHDLSKQLLSLEWLREMPDEEAREFLMSIEGLGRKSVACIMLLTLGKKEFPVDTNVGRISARLGWIPLESSQAIEDMDDYAPEPEVHAYLRSRLLGFDIETLYELHYQMITLGKIFCSKQNPHCSACPMRSDCEYAMNNGPSLHGRKKERVKNTTTMNTTTAMNGVGVGNGGGHQLYTNGYDQLYGIQTSNAVQQHNDMLYYSTPATMGTPLYYDSTTLPTTTTTMINNTTNNNYYDDDQYQYRRLHWKTKQKMQRLEQERVDREQNYSLLTLDDLIEKRKTGPRTNHLRRPRTNYSVSLLLPSVSSSVSLSLLEERNNNDGGEEKEQQQPSSTAAMDWDVVLTTTNNNNATGDDEDLVAVLLQQPPLPPPQQQPSTLLNNDDDISFINIIDDDGNDAVLLSQRDLDAITTTVLPVIDVDEQLTLPTTPVLTVKSKPVVINPTTTTTTTTILLYHHHLSSQPLPQQQHSVNTTNNNTTTNDHNNNNNTTVLHECNRLQCIFKEMTSITEALNTLLDHNAHQTRVHKNRMLELSLQALKIDSSLSIDSARTVTTLAKKQYHLLARVLHPDKCKVVGADDAFAAINRAITIINDYSDPHSSITTNTTTNTTATMDNDDNNGDDIDTQQQHNNNNALGQKLTGRDILNQIVWNNSRLVLPAYIIPTNQYWNFPCQQASYDLECSNDYHILFLPLHSIPTMKNDVVYSQRETVPVDSDGLFQVRCVVSNMLDILDGDNSSDNGSSDNGSNGSDSGSDDFMMTEMMTNATTTTLHGTTTTTMGKQPINNTNNNQQSSSPYVEGVLLVTARAALWNRFPLNGTYFQINEVFADHSTILQPIKMQQSIVDKSKATAVYFGLGIHFLSKGMTQQEVATMFSEGWVCFRSFDPVTKAPMILPHFLMPNVPTPSKSTWKNKHERAAAKAAKESKRFAKLQKHTNVQLQGGNVSIIGDSSNTTNYNSNGMVGQQSVQDSSLSYMNGNFFSTTTTHSHTLPSTSSWLHTPKHKPLKRVKKVYTTSDAARHAKSGKGKSRQFKYPIIRSKQRCGVCKACMNPHWKKACEKRRAEQIAYDGDGGGGGGKNDGEYVP